MSLRDAFNVLDIQSGKITSEDIKQAYRKAAQKYHPDRNPAGLDMMKMVNAAYETLRDFEGEVFAEGRTNYGESVNVALNSIIGLGLDIEVCGTWVWVTGNTKPHKDILKAANFKWAHKKAAWYFRPEGQKARRHHKSWSMDKIRESYGSKSINDKNQAQLQTV